MNKSIKYIVCLYVLLYSYIDIKGQIVIPKLLSKPFHEESSDLFTVSIHQEIDSIKIYVIDSTGKIGFFENGKIKKHSEIDISCTINKYQKCKNKNIMIHGILYFWIKETKNTYIFSTLILL